MILNDCVQGMRLCLQMNDGLAILRRDLTARESAAHTALGAPTDMEARRRRMTADQWEPHTLPTALGRGLPAQYRR